MEVAYVHTFFQNSWQVNLLPCMNLCWVLFALFLSQVRLFWSKHFFLPKDLFVYVILVFLFRLLLIYNQDILLFVHSPYKSYLICLIFYYFDSVTYFLFSWRSGHKRSKGVIKKICCLWHCKEVLWLFEQWTLNVLFNNLPCINEHLYFCNLDHFVMALLGTTDVLPSS